MTKLEKQRFWQEHVSNWKASGSSSTDYCHKHGLKPSTFAYWRYKQNKSRHKLVPLELGSIGSSVSMTLPGSIHMEIPTAQLEQVLPLIFRLARVQD